MNFLRTRKRGTIIFAAITLAVLFCICVIVIYIFCLEQKHLKTTEEIERVEAYFEDTFELYRIPPWVEIAPILTNPTRLRHTNYLLQSEEDKNCVVKSADGTERSILVGIPYFPFSSREEAEKIYNQLSDNEKEGYIIVSCSIIYYGKCEEEQQKIIEEAAYYFSN